MKITAGKYKGKNIESRSERTLRPTTARIREAIFNILKHGRFLNNDDFIHDDNPSLIKNRRIVDIFCGTGALGIEALSRGAEHVVFIDQNPKTLSLARKNVESITQDNNTTFIRSDSTLLPLAKIPCRLAFIDPPYNKNLVIPALKSLVFSKWLENGSVVVIEHGKREDIEIPENFTLLDDRIHDKTRITILQYRPI